MLSYLILRSFPSQINHTCTMKKDQKRSISCHMISQVYLTDILLFFFPKMFSFLWPLENARKINLGITFSCPKQSCAWIYLRFWRFLDSGNFTQLPAQIVGNRIMISWLVPLVCSPGNFLQHNFSNPAPCKGSAIGK